MRQHALLRLLLACFLFYVAWPSVQVQNHTIGSFFWMTWLVFLFMVMGANLAILLKLPVQVEYEEEESTKEKEFSLGKN
ncbi:MULTISPECIES: hypothetical protein [Pontibacillus]|uniref:Uncharacterized protein n=1 Tax=Pontibacillus chungwhensis TaxID=265426 RepID=A0ABY8UXT4_9BACI|nr:MULTISPECIES: hypothetical protein [Pontibacillus]MCD5323849.1 hypothetical protein [Pontibacillus sp. HN14]WIF97210.1 hypothetical protein QNI29_15895 [Pontibacillus chungwhensis]